MFRASSANIKTNYLFIIFQFKISNLETGTLSFYQANIISLPHFTVIKTIVFQVTRALNISGVLFYQTPITQLRSQRIN